MFNPARNLSQIPSTAARLGPGVIEEEAEGDDEMLPAMADDDYSAQLSWQSQSKDNLKFVYMWYRWYAEYLLALGS